MVMELSVACEKVKNGWVSGVSSYKIDGNKVALLCKSHSGRSTYEAEVIFNDDFTSFHYSDPYGSNTPFLFGKNVIQLVNEGKITR